MKNLKNILLAVLAVLAIASCSKKDEPIAPPAPVNEEEVITTATLVLTPVGGGTTATPIITLKSYDANVNDSTPPIVTGVVPFVINTTYNGVISVLNESVSPAKNISAEILAEAADHQFFYQTLSGLPMFMYTPVAVAPYNYDTNGKPLGFKTVFTTTTAVPQSANASMKITLKHQGNKCAAGVAAGDITNATGESDFEVVFYGIRVQ